MEYCHECDKMIDLDVDEHFEHFNSQGASTPKGRLNSDKPEENSSEKIDFTITSGTQTLSNKMKCYFNEDGTKIEFDYFEGKDVREAVKRLKEEFGNVEVNAQRIYKKPHIIYEEMIKLIDKIFGKELTK